MIAYRIADIGFGFDVTVSAESGYFGRFRISLSELDSLDDKHIFESVGSADKLPAQEDKIFSGESWSVFSSENGFVRVTDRFDNEPYKCFCFCRSGMPGGKLFFTGAGEKAQRTSAELFRLIDLFSSLLFYDAFLIHGAAVELGGKAYIFSGRSGIGKSTQAELWRKFNGAKILNGDRVILRKIKNEWKAFGVPMCGSSDICECFSLPVGALIFLDQGSENRVSVPDSFERLKCLLPQVGFSPSDDLMRQKFDILAGELASQVRMIKYRCTADESAAAELKRYFEL